MAHGLRRTAFDQASYAYWTGQYGVVNVKDFGAVGDGVHDDTAAIQRAINAASHGGIVFLPPGHYLISASLTVSTDSLTILGAGIDNPLGNGTQIIANGTFDAIVIGTANSITAGQCGIENLTILYAGSPTAGYAIRSYSGLNLYRRLWIANAYGAICFEGSGVTAITCEDIWAPTIVGSNGFYWINAPGGGKCTRCFVSPQSNNTNCSAFTVDTGSGSVTLEECGTNSVLHSVTIQNSQSGTAPANIWVKKFSADGIPVTGIPFYILAGTMLDFDTCWSDGGQHHLYVGPGGATNIRVLNANFTNAQENGVHIAEALTHYEINLEIGSSTISNSGISASGSYADILVHGGVSNFAIHDTNHVVAGGSAAKNAVEIGVGCNNYQIHHCDFNSVSNPIYSASIAGDQKVSNNLNYNPVGLIIPPASPLVSGTVYQNTYLVDIVVYQPAYATTSGTAGTVAVALGASSTPSTLYTKQIGGSTSSTEPDVCTLRVPPGWYYSFTTSGTTLLDAQIQGE